MIDKLLNAGCPEDVFGSLKEPKLESLRHAYLSLAKVYHPDRGGTEEAFSKLQHWHELGITKVHAGTYGNGMAEVSIKTGRKTYKLIRLVATGDICDCYEAAIGGSRVFLKLVRNHKNNDLVENEAKILDFIKVESKVREKEVTHVHIPDLLDRFEIKDPTKRKVNIINLLEGYYSLRQLRQLYSNGVDPIHAVWMWNRMLGAFAACHQAGIVHGAVTPDHFLIHPESHNGVLVDWSYAVKIGEKLKAIPGKWSVLYPDLKGKALPGLDINMAAGCFVYLVGGDCLNRPYKMPDIVPRAIQGFIRSCLLTGKYQPQDALEVHKEFSELLKAVYGPRRYQKLEIPQ